MTETQRQSVPGNDDDELDTALAFLNFARQSLVKKLDDLNEDQVRKVLVPKGTSLLGLVRHSTDGERFWFGYHLTGIGSEPNWGEGMSAAPGTVEKEVIADYVRAIAASDLTIRHIGDPEATSALSLTGARRTLRWTTAHMTSETARHAGHADILRELIDGTTGR
ncbi:DinB family protein [Lapillicoccus sp.]|uniref:DinB family protein n=1 Tax=Lapillicoccus sp. TaxID=1909287 RepID=UPI00326556F3